MKVYNAKAKPRVLMVDLTDDEERIVRQRVPTALSVDTPLRVHHAEWDLVVQRGGELQGIANSLNVLIFGAQALGRGTDDSEYQYGNSTIGYWTSTLETELYVGSSLPPLTERAVRTDLLPKASQRSDHEVVCVGTWVGSITVLRPRVLRPFLATKLCVLAGSFTREGFASECWALPSYADFTVWLDASLAEWRDRYPDRFPRAWTEQERWLTFAEAELVRERAALETEWQRVQSDMDSRAAALDSRQLGVQQEAVHGRRRLLTAQGDDLVEAVSEALVELGIEVENMDSKFPPSDRREDLRVTCSEKPGWEALVEVKGYGGGAQLGDLLKIDRHAQRYANEKGGGPAICWYIANQFVNQAPADRPVMLSSNPEELKAFREERLLALIDTAQLFVLAESVVAGKRSREAARRMLLDCVDVLFVD